MDPISGVIGGLIVLCAQRIIDVPGQVRHNDELCRNCDDDLLVLVDREDCALGDELDRIENDMAAAGQLYSGARSNARAHARERKVQIYMDKLRESERAVRA